MKTIDILNKYKSDTAGKWREEAEYRRRNAKWLRISPNLVALTSASRSMRRMVI